MTATGPALWGVPPCQHSMDVSSGTVRQSPPLCRTVPGAAGEEHRTFTPFLPGVELPGVEAPGCSGGYGFPDRT